MKPKIRSPRKAKGYLKWRLFAVPCALGVWAAAGPLKTQAAVVTNVNIVNFAFSPPSVTVNVNDQVEWTWAGNFHSTTSTGGLWDSGVHNVPFAYTNKFSTAGTFGYICSIHLFAGSVTVLAVVNTPPTVGISNPPDGAVFSAPASFSLEASASDSDGSVTNVQFFQGGVSVGNAASSPYSVAITNLGAGDYTFSAVATDNGGATATNTIAVHAVTPVPVTIGALQRLSASTFQFNYSANVGLKYVVQRSANLTDWIGLSTNMAGSNPVSFLDGNASGSLNFYRVGRLPNP
jgi:plastocyanin